MTEISLIKVLVALLLVKGHFKLQTLISAFAYLHIISVV